MINVSVIDEVGNIDIDIGILVIDIIVFMVVINDLIINDIILEFIGIVNDLNVVVVVIIDGNDYIVINNGNGIWILVDNIVVLFVEGNYMVMVIVMDVVGNFDLVIGLIVIDVSIDENNNG